MKVIISIFTSLISGFLSLYAFIGYRLNVGGGYLSGNDEARMIYLGILIISLVLFISSLIWSKYYLYCVVSFLFSSIVCIFYISM